MFYFAACNTYYPAPKLLGTWSSVITADAIKTSDSLKWGDSDTAVALPIGGTKQSRIYMEGSTSIGELSQKLGNKSAEEPCQNRQELRQHHAHD